MSNDNIRNEKSMKTLTRIIGIIAALVVGLIAFIITFIANGEAKTATRVLTALGAFFCAFFFATAIFYLVFAFMQKNRFFGIISYFAASIGLVILLIVLSVKWYFVVLAAVFVFILFWLVSVALYSKKLTLVADNAKPDYKTYEQRKAEEAAKPAEPEEELPEIKSFKD